MERTPDDILDEWLVLSCQGGDREALRELVTRWQPKLWRHARYLAGQSEGAAEIVQESWLAIVRGLPRLRDPAAFRAWAYRIVAHRCADWIRRRQKDRAIAPPSAAQPDHPLALTKKSTTDSDDLIALRAALKRLPVEQRHILRLCYHDGLSVNEIRHVLDIPAGTVKSRLHHARNTLRDTLERTRT